MAATTMNLCVACFPVRVGLSGRGGRAHSVRASAGEASESEKELAAKLAAAEAEAQALRRELAARAGGARAKAPAPDKRVDGTGYRESLLIVPGEGERPDEWGLTEASFLEQEEEEAKEENSTTSGKQTDEVDNALVYRRLLIGVSLSAAAIVLAFFKPAGLLKPPKPLLFYLVRILQLKQQLMDLEQSTSDTKTVLAQLERVYKSAGDWKDVLLSAAAWLEGDAAEKASSLAYAIYDYLEQAEYKKYFDPIGQPSEADLLQFARFSLESTKAARELVQEFLSLAPKDFLREADLNLKALEQ